MKFNTGWAIIAAFIEVLEIYTFFAAFQANNVAWNAAFSLYTMNCAICILWHHFRLTLYLSRMNRFCGFFCKLWHTGWATQNAPHDITYLFTQNGAYFTVHTVFSNQASCFKGKIWFYWSLTFDNAKNISLVAYSLCSWFELDCEYECQPDCLPWKFLMDHKACDMCRFVIALLPGLIVILGNR